MHLLIPCLSSIVFGCGSESVSSPDDPVAPTTPGGEENSATEETAAPKAGDPSSDGKTDDAAGGWPDVPSTGGSTSGWPTVDPSTGNSGNTGSSSCGEMALDWNSANLTWYESYPDPGSDECIYYNGCDYVGQFAYFGGEQKPEQWVANNNIAAVHSKDWEQLAGKSICVKSESGNAIEATVYDLCSDGDCNGCCSANSVETGYLIDLEINTIGRLGQDSGIVEWACLDC